MNLQKKIQNRYKVEGDKKEIKYADLSTRIGFNGVTQLNKYLYVLERLLWLNSGNSNISATFFIDPNSTKTANYLPNNFMDNFFETDELWLYGIGKKDRKNATKIFKDALQKIGQQFFYYKLIASFCIHNIKEYDLALEILDTAINDYNLNRNYWEQNYNDEEETLAVFLTNLHLLRARTHFELATKNKSKETYIIDLIEKSIEDYEKYPIKKLEHSEKTYFACALNIVGKDRKDKSLLQKSLVLYSESIDEDKGYITGYLNAIKLAFELKQYKLGKLIVEKLSKNKNKKHYKEYPDLQEIIDKFELLFAD